MGTLIATGTLALTQLWSRGESDADTLRLTLRGEEPFSFQEHPGAPPRPTRVFEGAYVRVKGGKQPVIRKNRQLCVRLQGIDAPELHYHPVNKLPELRQCRAESAALALGDHLAQVYGATELACEAITAVESPNDVFDMYGRYVGDVVITEPAGRLNLNQWLIREGWALPSFYNSMADDEIDLLVALSQQARAARRNLVKPGVYNSRVGALDTTLRYRPPGSPRQKDGGRFIMPKLFRRLYQWRHKVDTGATATTNLPGFLLEPSPSKRDKFLLTADYLAQGPAATQLDLGEAFRKDGRFRYRPEQVVFKEAPSTLFSARGRVVEEW